MAVVCFIVALAGPRKILQEVHRTVEGIDIILTIDSSGSMAAEDFVIQGQRLNRLAVVKKVVEDFIAKRTSDRIGLVTFAARAYTVCPLTTDYKWLIENLKRIDLGLIEDGTAIGSAIATSLNRLKHSSAKSKIIILLTDGVNNAGKIDPITAAHIAETMGVKIYTIGVGSKGYVPFPVRDVWGRTIYQQVKIELNEETLRRIAKITGGEYYLATNTEALKEIYKEIDKLEKSRIEETGYKEYQELFMYPLGIALILLIAEMVLRNTILIRIP